MNEYFREISWGFDKCLQQKSKDVWWACITWPRKSAKLSWSSLLLGAIANKATSPDPSVWLCSVSLPISVFFTHSLLGVLRKGHVTAPKRRGLIACVLNEQHKRQNFWAQIIIDPYRRPLTLTFLLVSTRGLFQDMMFERLRDSTFSEDASEVTVQPLPCGTKYYNILL